MSDEDRDVDIESDADKRAHHNALERKRRDHIKDSFSSLRDSVPSLQGEKVSFVLACTSRNNAQQSTKASRAQILKKAAEYIQFMRRKNTAHQQDIDDLKRQNKTLEEQIKGSEIPPYRRNVFDSEMKVRSLEKTKVAGNFASATVLESSHVNSKGDSISAFDGGSGSESSDTEGSGQSLRKKLKTSPTATPVHS